MDVFISYRRDTGSSQAALIAEKLKSRKINAFLDRHGIHNEDFFEKLKKNIDNAPNFLIILTPGYFKKKPTGEKDWVREELLYAKKKKKHFIALAFPGYDHNEIDWDAEIDEIKAFATFNVLPFNDETERLESASIDSIIEGMVDRDGNKFSLSRRDRSNSWYASHEMTEEDLLWIISDHDVCKRMDWEMLERALAEPVFSTREEINLFVYKAYEIKTYEKKYALSLTRGTNRSPKIDHIYGVTSMDFLQDAEETFGADHFVPDCEGDKAFAPEDYIRAMDRFIEENQLDGFDIVDLTLVLKDTKNPENILCEIAERLNPNGAVVYIRELDDDYVDAYPDENGYIKKMIELLELDDGAGNRHTGKKIYTYLKKAGADRVYISDKLISTANRKANARKRICDTYFSYLVPEMRALAADQEDEKHEEYSKALHWLETHYDAVVSLFRSSEFYFRAGYIAGYGVFEPDEACL